MADTPFQVAGSAGKEEKRITAAELLVDSAKNAVLAVQSYAESAGARS